MPVKDAISKMFSGDKINETEGRAVLHTALRDFSDREILVDGENIKPQIKKFLTI
jgi:glucose-6-phosphate isomerase